MHDCVRSTVQAYKQARKPCQFRLLSLDHLACNMAVSNTTGCLQICRWEFLAFSGTFKTLLNVHEERDAGRVVFSLIKSSFMKDFEGQWQVKHHNLHA